MNSKFKDTDTLTQKQKHTIKQKSELEKVMAYLRHLERKSEKVKHPKKTRKVDAQMFTAVGNTLNSITRAATGVGEVTEAMGRSNLVHEASSTLASVRDTTERVDGLMDKIERMFGEHGRKIYSKIAFTALRLGSDHSLFGVMLVIVEFLWEFAELVCDPIDFLISRVWPYVERALSFLAIPLKVCNREAPGIESQADYGVENFDWPNLVPMGAGVAALLSCCFYGQHVMADREAMKRMTQFATYGANMSKIKSGVNTAMEFVSFVMNQVQECLMQYCPGLIVNKTAKMHFLDAGVDLYDYVGRVEELTDRSQRLKVLTDVNTANKLQNLMIIRAKILLAIVKNKVKLTQGCQRVVESVNKRLHDFAREFEVDNASSSIRPTPFHVSLFGEPGCGKSNVAGYLATDLINPEFCTVGIAPDVVPYTRNAADAYWSGYAQQPVVLIDDFAQTKGSPPAGSEYLEMIFMISGISWRPVMSKNEDKGIMFTSRLVISTTNQKYPQPEEVYSSKAIWRRRNALVEVILEDGTKRLDDPSRNSYRLWETCPENHNNARLLHDGLTYPQLVGFLVRDFNLFAENDKIRKQFGSMLKETDLEDVRRVTAQADEELDWKVFRSWKEEWQIFQKRLRKITYVPEFNSAYKNRISNFVRVGEDDIFSYDLVDESGEHVEMFYGTSDLLALELTQARPWQYAYYRSFSSFEALVCGDKHKDWWKLQGFCNNCRRYDCHQRPAYDKNGTYWRCFPLCYWDGDSVNREHYRMDNFKSATQWTLDYPAYSASRQVCLYWHEDSKYFEEKWDSLVGFTAHALPSWDQLTDRDKEGVFLSFGYGLIRMDDFGMYWQGSSRTHRRWMSEAGPLCAFNEYEIEPALKMRNVRAAYKYWHYNRMRDMVSTYRQVSAQTIEYDLSSVQMLQEEEEQQMFDMKANFEVVRQSFPHIMNLCKILAVVTSVFSLYKLYRLFSPTTPKKTAEGFFGKSDERLWLEQQFNKVHGKYIAMKDLTPEQQKMWQHETQDVYGVYHHGKIDGRVFKPESGGGPSGDSRTRRLQQARIVREDGLGALDMVVGVDHGDLPEDGQRYMHNHECEECGNIFSHSHVIKRVGQYRYRHLCRGCRRVRQEGSEDTAALTLLQDTLVPKNCVEMVTHVNGRIRKMCAIGIAGRLLLAPWHFFADRTGEIDLEVTKHVFGTTYHKVRIGREVQRMQTKARGQQPDLAIVQLSRSVSCFPNIIKHFVTDDSVKHLSRTVGQFSRLKVKNGATMPLYTDNVLMSLMTEQVEYDIVNGETLALRGIEYYQATVPGDCGAIVSVLNTKVEGVIAGMHLAGDEDLSQGFAACVTREWLQQEVDRMGFAADVRAMAEAQGFEEPTDKINVIPTGNLVVVGMARPSKAERFVDKTDIIPSAIHGKVSPPVTFPSVLSPSDIRITERRDVTPMEKAVEKYAIPIYPFSLDKLDQAEQIFGNIINKVSPTGMTRRLLTVGEAINGVPAANYARINMLTSPGRPYKEWRPVGSKGKRFLFEMVNDDPLEYAIAATRAGNTLAENLENRWIKAQSGDRVFGYAYSNLKDERRKEKKIKAGMTRSFECMPLDYNLLCRIYFGAFIAAMNQNCVSLPSSVGIDPSGPRWTQLYNRLSKFGGQVFAGDYVAWDGKFDGEVAARIVRKINEWYNDGPVNAMVRIVLMDEITHTFLLLGNTLVQKNQGMLSGVILTADINSEENLFYFIIAYLEIAEKYGIDVTELDFTKEVECAFYGDDHVIAPSQKIQKWFNFTTVSEFFASHNIGYTDATKSDREVPPLEALEEVTFLKRKFVPHAKFPNRILAPIENDTIMEEINWIRKSADDRLALFQNLSTVKREAYHHGETYFNDTVIKINTALTELQQLELARFKVSSWELLTRNYEEYDRVWNEQFLN